MTVNVVVRLFVPVLLLSTARSNPPLAEFKGVYDFDVSIPEHLAMVLRGVVESELFDLRIVDYKVSENLLTLIGYVPGKSLADVEKFIAKDVAGQPGWTVSREAFDSYKKRP
ncbi:hypothetical protein EPO17_01225 [Patescibacteria group bacterium]|nr:MAG: hypothetical protein EPO17_01225 [Patescibacteria group bacterium]